MQDKRASAEFQRQVLKRSQSIQVLFDSCCIEDTLCSCFKCLSGVVTSLLHPS